MVMETMLLNRYGTFNAWRYREAEVMPRFLHDLPYVHVLADGCAILLSLLCSFLAFLQSFFPETCFSCICMKIKGQNHFMVASNRSILHLVLAHF